VAGNFHIAHGESIVRDGKHIHQFNPMTAPLYNISHTINSLSFGEEYQGMPRNPLDSVVRIVKKETNTGLFQYFIRIIPTIYRYFYLTWSHNVVVCLIGSNLLVPMPIPILYPSNQMPEKELTTTCIVT
jgi:hypothetical protein